MRSILQIVPRPPGPYEAVGQYALMLAEQLAAVYGWQTIFVAAAPAAVSHVKGFEIFSSVATFAEDELRARQCEHVILHYANYGYHNRGVPFWLVQALRRIRRICGGRFLAVFHEVYASGPPWKSEFWLQPFQIQVARKIARMTDTCLVTNPVTRAQVLSLRPPGPVSTQPVFSNFGEPEFSASQLRDRDPHRWVICGGGRLVERSVRSFFERLAVIPVQYRPHELFVVGGEDNPVVRQKLESSSEVKTHYFPQTSPMHASEILSSCTWGFIDYFHRRDVPTGMIFKSTSFAAYCAHGVIPVFPHAGSNISVSDDRLPGPYYIDTDCFELPDNCSEVAAALHAWYGRHAASKYLGQTVALALGLDGSGPRS